MRLSAVSLIVSLIVTFVLLGGFMRFCHLAPEVTKIKINKPYGIFISNDNPHLKYIPKPNSGDIGDINVYGIRDRPSSTNFSKLCQTLPNISLAKQYQK